MPTTHLLTKQSGNANLDAVFDPYVSGTSPPATGLLNDSGVDIASNIYAPIALGSAAAVTGLLTKQSGNADINTLFAAYGTAKYALPINGNTYIESVNITSGTANCAIGFEILAGTTWEVYGTTSLGGSTNFASGAIPTGATAVKYTFGTYTVGVGQTDAGGATTNGAATNTAVSGNPKCYYTTATATATSGSKDRQYPLTIDFYNSGGTNISHTVITIIGDTEGSV